MKTLYLERSTGECRKGDWVEKLDLDGIDRIVVGTGPGSFAGIRSAIAFAQGFAIGRKCGVYGLPSPCAVAAEVYGSVADPSKQSCRGVGVSDPLAVVGDARRGKFWIALFEGMKLVCPIFQVEQDLLALRIPLGAKIVTPDDERIDALLKEVFADRYIGGVKPTEKGLEAFAQANPSALSPEPLPLYLNPAVRESES